MIVAIPSRLHTCVEDSSELPSAISSLYTAYCTCQNHDNNTRTTHQGRQARVCPCCAPATRFIEARPVAPSLPAANTTTNTITTSFDNHIADIRYEDIRYGLAIVIVACFAQLSPPHPRRYRSSINGGWVAR